MRVLMKVYSNKYKTEHMIFITFDPRLTYKDRLWMIQQIEIITDTLIHVSSNDIELFTKGYTKELLTINLN